MSKLEMSIQKRASDRFFGLILFLLGVTIFLDSPFMFPVPLTGIPSVLAGGLLSAFGGYRLYRGLKLPLYEVLLWIEHKGGCVRIAQLENFLGKQEDIGQVIQELEKRELCILSEHDLSYVEKEKEPQIDLLILTDKGKGFLSTKNGRKFQRKIL